MTSEEQAKEIQERIKQAESRLEARMWELSKDETLRAEQEAEIIKFFKENPEVLKPNKAYVKKIKFKRKFRNE